LNKRRSARIEQRKNLCELIRQAHFRRTGCPGVPAVSWCDEPPPLLLLEAVAQFNRGDYFEQHETLELLWRAEARPVRRLYQGILQIGVAFHHLRRRNYHGVVYMLTRGAAYLKPFAPRCQGVDVGALLDAAALALRTVEALGPTRLHEFDWRLAPQVLLEPRSEAPD
jgi:predicted metal-dependent hydrolase